MNNVFIAGAGTMGLGIAEVFASKGFSVTAYDLTDQLLKKAADRLDKSLSRRLEKGKMNADEKEKLLSCVKFTADINRAASADIVIEAAAESIEVKQDIFRRLSGICKKDTVFATNTSSISVTLIASVVSDPSKFVGMHFFNPPAAMQLVEVIRGVKTSDETFGTVFELSKQIGKTPVEVQEAPGFVVNRLLNPMINEAVALLAEGVASAESIDTAMKLGANHPMGPLALGDLIGLDVVLAIMDTLFDETKDPKYRAHPLLRKMVRAGRLGRKTGRGFFEY
ncbi:MAG: putative 3-hydroxybutyryl-CoA dehydrogenase [Firmicutes bacterium ADurb.Bin182]|nr:MAG: putative 3-hydroxybutyryl-CoA dehydrogenase [Firmicutes bacterium ADurb.Bin182]